MSLYTRGCRIHTWIGCELPQLCWGSQILGWYHWSGMGLTPTSHVTKGLGLLIKAGSSGTLAPLFGSLPSLAEPVAVRDHPSGNMAQDMTLLWGSGSPPCWRVMIALEEKEVKGYNQKLLSFEKMEHKSKEVMEMNPRGQVNLESPRPFVCIQFQ